MTSMLAIPEGEPPGRPSRRPGSAARFVAGRAVSDCGDWLTTVAVAVGLYTVTRSLAAPALAILFRVAPRPLGALAGGRVADRFGPLPALVVLNAGRAAVTALLAISLHAGLVPAALALLAVSQAAGGAVQPAGQAAIPLLVPPDGVGRLNAALGVVDSTALVIGPGIAAGLLGLLGPGSGALLVGADAISFLVLAGILAGMTGLGRSRRSGEPEPWRPWSGIGFILGRPFLRQLALAQLGVFGAITCLQAVLPAAAEQRLGSAAATGWVYAAVGAGNAAGALTLLGTRHRGLSSGSLALLTLGELLPLAAFAVVGPAWIDVALAGLSGLASAPYEILAVTELVRRVPTERLGEVSGAMWLFGYAGMLGGGLLAAGLAPSAGWMPTLLLACVAALLVLVSGWVRPRHAAGGSEQSDRRLRGDPEAAELG